MILALFYAGFLVLAIQLTLAWKIIQDWLDHGQLSSTGVAYGMWMFCVGAIYLTASVMVAV